MFNNSTPFTMPVTPAYGTGYNSGNGMFGADGWWVIIILALLFGWGGNGFGGSFGGGNGTLAATETQATLQRGFDHQTLVSKLDGLTNGISDSVFSLNNTLVNGFHGVDNAVCNLGYQTQQGFNQTNIALMQGQNALSSQLANCCCENREAISGLRYDMATQACDTRHAITDSTRQILDFLTTDKIATLQAENQSLKAAANIAQQNAYITANQEAQTAELIRRIAPYPVPAYSVPNPYGYGYGYGCGCSNGCGCA